MYLILIVNIYAIMFSVDNFIPPLQLTHIDCKHQCPDLLKFNQVNCKIALLWTYLHYQALTKLYVSLDQSTCRLHLFFFYPLHSGTFCHLMCVYENSTNWRNQGQFHAQMVLTIYFTLFLCIAQMYNKYLWILFALHICNYYPPYLHMLTKAICGTIFVLLHVCSITVRPPFFFINFALYAISAKLVFIHTMCTWCLIVLLTSRPLLADQYCVYT